MTNKSFYNNFFAAGYHRNWQDAPGKLVVLNYVLDHLSDGSTLLDVGCGDGYFVNRISEEAKSRKTALSCTGIDISNEAIDIAAASYPASSFFVMDAECLDLDTCTSNIVVSYGVLEHLGDPSAGVREIGRVLRKDGLFAMMMPTIGSYRKDRLDEGWYEDLNKPPQMQWNYKRVTWEDFFVGVGLKLEPVDLPVNYGAINPGNFYFGRKN